MYNTRLKRTFGISFIGPAFLKSSHLPHTHTHTDSCAVATGQPVPPWPCAWHSHGSRPSWRPPRRAAADR
jgi:hypothetical protein